MSFVITVVSPETVVQVSETRLSDFANQSPVCDNQRKSIIVTGKEVNFVLGWVGLARVGDHDTSNWLWKQLCGMNAAYLPLVRILDNLTGLATKHFATLPVSDQNRRCEFVLGGWHKVGNVAEPFTCTIYNDLEFQEGQSATPSPLREKYVASPHFMYCLAKTLPVRKRFNVTVTGDIDSTALRPHFSGLKALLKKRTEPAEVCGVCRRILLDAARRRDRTIGRNLIAVEMTNRGAIRASYYPDSDQEMMLLPDILTTQGAFVKASFRSTVVGDKVNTHLRGTRVVLAEQPTEGVVK
jgi:hypothetical protein